MSREFLLSGAEFVGWELHGDPVPEVGEPPAQMAEGLMGRAMSGRTKATRLLTGPTMGW